MTNLHHRTKFRIDMIPRMGYQYCRCFCCRIWLFQTEADIIHGENGFKYFDTIYKDMKVRCMFYGNCIGDDTDTFLYANTDTVRIDSLLVPVQSLVFYYENATKDSTHYNMVVFYYDFVKTQALIVFCHKYH